MSNAEQHFSRDFIKQVCVLYDPEDGRIAHVHRCETFPGGRKKSETEMAARAAELAAAAGRDTARLKALHVPSEHMHPGKIYKVDPSTRALVEMPRPPRRQK